MCKWVPLVQTPSSDWNSFWSAGHFQSKVIPHQICCAVLTFVMRSRDTTGEFAIFTCPLCIVLHSLRVTISSAALWFSHTHTKECYFQKFSLLSLSFAPYYVNCALSCLLFAIAVTMIVMEFQLRSLVVKIRLSSMPTCLFREAWMKVGSFRLGFFYLFPT